jgi:hypothetical protein
MLDEISCHAGPNILSRWMKYFVTLDQIYALSCWMKYFVTLDQIYALSRWTKYLVTLDQISYHTEPNILSH